MKTFRQFLEDYIPVRGDTLVGRHLGPRRSRRIRVYIDFHGQWESVGDFANLPAAEPTIRQIRWSGHRAKAVPYG